MAAVVSAPVFSGGIPPWRAAKASPSAAPSPAASTVCPSTAMGSPTPSSINPGPDYDSDGEAEGCGDFTFLTDGAESAAIAEEEQRWRLVGLRMASIFKEAAQGLEF